MVVNECGRKWYRRGREGFGGDNLVAIKDLKEAGDATNLFPLEALLLHHACNTIFT